MENNKAANLLKLMKMLETRLFNKPTKNPIDFNGNTVDGQVYATDRLITFLEISLAEFNQCPIFTFFTFEDTKFMDQFGAILVEGASIYALGSQALVEKGREFVINDTASNYTPPAISDLLQSQYAQLYEFHWEKLKYIKQHIKDFIK